MGSFEEVEAAALWLRGRWKLGLAPIRNVVDALEERLKELAKTGKRKSSSSMQISLFD